MVVENAIKTFCKNLGILMVFSISFLLGLLLPILASGPTYNASGGVFLRFMSIPEMSALDAFVIAFTFLLSNFFVAFGVVAVNLIVKSEKTMLNIATEVINNISKSTFTIFMIYIFLFLVNAFVQVFLVELNAPYWVSALAFLALYLPFFYIGPAIVIDELKPAHAVRSSIEHMKMYPWRVIKWVIVGLGLLITTSLVTYLIIPAYFQWITLMLNSFLIIPFLIVYQSHSYMEKFGILRTEKKKR
ncbi:MAG: hypothetical protein ACP5KJ_02700 [Candidatus Micrarchaeia archaeon]